MAEQWPHPTVMRGAKKKGMRYFGHYAHAHAIRETLDMLLRTFPVRTCRDGKFDRHAHLGKPCLPYHIEKCAGPCAGAIGGAAYREHQLAGGGPHLAFQPAHHGVGIAFEELQQLVHQMAAQQAHDIITTFVQLVLSSTPKVAAFTGLRR